MTLLPDLEAQLREAARRTQPASRAAHARRTLRPRRRMVLIALAVALAIASAAVAAVQLTAGDPAPKTTGLGDPLRGPGHPLPAGARLLTLRAEDPDGGPAWGIRVYRTTRDAACWQVGRVLDGRLGVIGRDGVLGDDGRFHELPVQRDQCRPLDGAGHLFAFQEALALDNGIQTRLTCRPRTFDPRYGPRLPVCPDGSARQLFYGFLGPLARTVTLSDGRHVAVSPAQDGAFLLVSKIDDPAARVLHPVSVSASYADGSSRVVDDVAPLESVDHAPPRGTLPPGYVAPERWLPDPARVRGRLAVTHRRIGKNTNYTIRFRAPVSVRRYGVEYSVLVDGPARGEGRACTDSMAFAGFNTNKDVRAGQRIAITLTPAIALRWNRGWCPGAYRVTVVLHDRAHPVGSFAFRAP
jgi:hypothetical protein